MELTRETDIKYIIDKFSYLQQKVSMLNKEHLYDIDCILEDFCVGLLNVIFDCRLHNLNIETKNTPAIDLADEDNHLCVQITSDKSGKKICSTITKFFDYELNKKYTRLLIVILVPKQEKYAIQSKTKGDFSFSPTSDILDFSDLVSEMKKKDKIHEVRKYIEAELSGGFENIDFQILDRIKEVINAIDARREKEVKLDIEFLFGEEVNRKYQELLETISIQIERADFLAAYESILKSILWEKGKEDEYEFLLAQSEQYDYYEPLYDFCDDYRIRTYLPYDISRCEFIDYRTEHKNILERSKLIDEMRQQLIELLKAESKELINRH